MSALQPVAPDSDDQPQPRPRFGPVASLLVVLVVTLVWRVPSLFDPPWVNDEGTYFAVAQAMAHGYRLYANIWENKPPGLYVLYSGVYHLVGPSLVSVRLLATGAVLVLVLVVYHIATRLAGEAAALVGAMLAGLLMGVPLLEGTTANAEVFIVPCTTAAVYLALVRERHAPAGALMGLAVLFKAVAGFDALALGIWLLLRRPRALIRYALALVIVLAVACAAAWANGILSPMLRDALFYDYGYVSHANGGGLPWQLALKLAALAVLTFALRRRPFPVLWLAYAVAGAVFGGRYFGHYALQIVPPMALCVALALRDRPRLARRLFVGLPAGVFALGLLSAVAGEALAATGHDSILARRLQYYANFTRLAVGAESYAAYRDQIDDHVTRNILIADRIRALPSGRLLVWGNTPWVYVLANRLPATPYTSALRSPEVPGETADLRRAIRERWARIVVAIEPPLPPLGPAARDLRQRYRLRARVRNAVIYTSAP